MGGLAKTCGFLAVFDDFGVFWRSGRKSSCHLGAYVGCKMGARWVQEAFESEFFDQLGELGDHFGAKIAR